MVVLFFLIINGFFRENIRLLDERNTWQERAKELEEKEAQLLAEKTELEHILMPERPGLIITNLRFEPLAFRNTHRLSYQLTLTIENRSNQPLPEGKGHLLLAFGPPGSSSFQRTSWQQATLPSFRPGEVKTILLPGETTAAPGEEMLLIFSIDQQPGVAKFQVQLTDPAEMESSLPE